MENPFIINGVDKNNTNSIDAIFYLAETISL
jgi:hypothetical protein